LDESKLQGESKEVDSSQVEMPKRGNDWAKLAPRFFRYLVATISILALIPLIKFLSLLITVTSTDPGDRIPPTLDVKLALQEAESTVLNRSFYYNREQERRFLASGLVISNDTIVTRGKIPSNLSIIRRDECDSLLFSALRTASLQRLGFRREYLTARAGVARLENSLRWIRHFNCPGTPLSRDMVMGLIVLWSVDPQWAKPQIDRFFGMLVRGGGFFDWGPPWMSFLSPGLAKLLLSVYMAGGGSKEKTPVMIQSGYSVIELNAFFIPRGYPAHLDALELWLRMELNPNKAKETMTTNKYGTWDLKIRLLTKNLLDIDEKNLFFRWLWLKSSGQLTPVARLTMLKELIAMPYFPTDAMPTSCDRGADYLWQRDSDSWPQLSKDACGYRTYPAVDFLFMASLLVDTHGQYENQN
jgi:hypothetical protein